MLAYRLMLRLLLALSVVVALLVSQGPGFAPAPVGAVDDPASLVVYEDAPGAGFWDGSWGYSARTPCDAGNKVSGACAYTVAFQPWGGLSFGAGGGFATAGYEALEFAFQPGGQPLGDFAARLTAYPSGNGLGALSLAQAQATPLAGGWVRLRVPLAALNPSGARAYTVQIHNNTGGSRAAVRVDLLRLVGPPVAGIGPAPNTTAPVARGVFPINLSQRARWSRSEYARRTHPWLSALPSGSCNGRPAVGTLPV